MQIFRTSRAQSLGPGDNELPETQNVDPELQNSVNDFFNQDPLAEEPVLPQSPFDLLFVGTPPAPGTEAANGAPSTSQFAPSRVVTLEQWLMAYPDGIHAHGLSLFKEKMEQILQTRFIDRREQLQQILQNGGLRPNEISAIQQLIADIDASIVLMRQEIEKAENKIREQNEIYFREAGAMEDLNNDGYIGDPNSEDHYRIATKNGERIIVDRNGKVAANPYLNPNYMPSLFSDDSVHLIDRNLHGTQPIGGELRTFDETFEIVPGAHGTFNAGIDVSVPEGFWVEADADGKPIIDEDGLMKPKSFESIEGRYGQKPPTEAERDRWVFVKVAVLEIESEPVTHIRFADDPDNDAVNEDGSRGGFVHYIFKGYVNGQEATVMRMRFQGVEVRSHNPLVSDGSNYIAATTVGIAVNGGDPEALPDSARISPIHIDASRYQSTGKVIPAQTQQGFLSALGIDNVIQPGGQDRLRALAALHDNLYAGFLLDSPAEVRQELATEYGISPMLRENEDDPDAMPVVDRPVPWEIHQRFLDENGNVSNKTAYIPRDSSSTDRIYESLRSGLASVGLRGVIQGAGNDIIVVPPPNEESLRSLLAPGAEPIDPSNPAYGTVVEAGRRGRNIVVSQGGDIYVQNATFFWREPERDGSTRKDMIYVDSEFVNRPSTDNISNPRLFFHIGDTNPELVAIANGVDIHEDDVRDLQNEDEDADPNEELPAANDDWYQGRGTDEQIADYGASANDIPGGLDFGNFAEAIGEQTRTATGEAWQRIMEEVIRLDPLADFQATEEGGWDIPEEVTQEQEQYNAFFAEWEFFTDQEPDMSLESLREEA